MTKKNIRLIFAVCSLALCILMTACLGDGSDGGTGAGGDKAKTVKLTKKNYSDYIEFTIVDDESSAENGKVKFTFKAGGKDDCDFEDLDLTVKATVYYWVEGASLEEHESDGISIKYADDPSAEIEFEDESIINYNGRIVESVKYEVTKISGKAIVEEE